MARAQIATPEGFSIKIEGTPAEIAAVVADLKKQEDDKPAKHTVTKRGRTSLVSLVESLIDGGFFKKPRTLADVKNALEEMGHHYPQTTLSGTMLSKVRKRQLRRLRTNKVWSYAA